MAELSILVCGKTGVGKSSLVNAIFGEDLVTVGGPGSASQQTGQYSCLSAVTAGVHPVRRSIQGIDITVYDSPGLQDGSDKDESYLNQISEVVDVVKLVLYCFDMTTSRWLPADQTSIQLMTQRFGVKFWSKAILVLTRANMYQYSTRPQNQAKITEWEKRCEAAFYDLANPFKDQLKKLLPSEKHCVDSIPVISVGNNQAEPDERELIFVAPGIIHADYLAELWVQCVKRLPPDEYRLLFLQATDVANVEISQKAQHSTSCKHSLMKIVESIQNYLPSQFHTSNSDDQKQVLESALARDSTLDIEPAALPASTQIQEDVDKPNATVGNPSSIYTTTPKPETVDSEHRLASFGSTQKQESCTGHEKSSSQQISTPKSELHFGSILNRKKRFEPSVPHTNDENITSNHKEMSTQRSIISADLKKKLETIVLHTGPENTTSKYTATPMPKRNGRSLSFGPNQTQEGPSKPRPIPPVNITSTETQEQAHISNTGVANTMNTSAQMPATTNRAFRSNSFAAPKYLQEAEADRRSPVIVNTSPINISIIVSDPAGRDMSSTSLHSTPTPVGLLKPKRTAKSTHDAYTPTEEDMVPVVSDHRSTSSTSTKQVKASQNTEKSNTKSSKTEHNAEQKSNPKTKRQTKLKLSEDQVKEVCELANESIISTTLRGFQQGATIGAVLGSLIPGLGTAAGAVVGGAICGILCFAVGSLRKLKKF